MTTVLKFAPALALLVPFFAWGGPASGASTQGAPAPERSAPKAERNVAVQYLEVVTPDVDATCATLAKLHGVTFGKPVVLLGNARTAALRGGGRIGVRPPMRKDEAAVVRPYVLVDDVEAAVKCAKETGAQFAMEATTIPGEGTFAIYVQGGVQYGLWKD